MNSTSPFPPLVKAYLYSSKEDELELNTMIDLVDCMTEQRNMNFIVIHKIKNARVPSTFLAHSINAAFPAPP